MAFLFLFIYKFFSLNNRNNFWKGHILLHVPYYQSAKKKSFLYVCFIFRFKQLHHKEKPREIQSCYPICHLCVPHKHFWFVLSMLHRTASLHDKKPTPIPASSDKNCLTVSLIKSQ